MRSEPSPTQSGPGRRWFSKNHRWWVDLESISHSRSNQDTRFKDRLRLSQSLFTPAFTGITRIHYAPKQNGKITVKIYDFALNLVATLINNQFRQAGIEYDEIWDSRNKDGKIVANGVYFFKVEAEGGQKEWGKVAVIR